MSLKTVADISQQWLICAIRRRLPREITPLGRPVSAVAMPLLCAAPILHRESLGEMQIGWDLTRVPGVNTSSGDSADRTFSRNGGTCVRMTKTTMDKFIDWTSRAVYVIAGAVLTLISLLMVAFAVWEVVDALIERRSYIDPSLDAIGLIVVSMAVFDIAKYLYEEQIVHEAELKSAREARETLTKFLIIIIIAVTLEALVFIFRVGSTDVTQLLFPTGLLLAAVALVVGLGWYQRLSLDTEEQLRKADQRP